MSTEFFNDQWRIPSNENQNKVSNYSMDFDGTSDKIEFGDVNGFDRTDAFSGSCWINLTSVNTTQLFFTKIKNSTIVGYQFYITASNSLVFFIGDFYSNNYLLARTNNTLNASTWYNIAFTYDGSSARTGIKLYVNSVPQSVNYLGSTTITGSIVDSLVPFQISGRDGANVLLDGKIDQVSIFDYALSATQVSTLYGGGTAITNPMALNPVAYYQLGDQSVDNGANYLVPNNSLSGSEGFSRYALSFDGLNDSLNFNNAGSNIMTNKNAISVSGWFKLDSNISSVVCSSWYGGAAAQYLLRYNSSTGLGIQWYIYSNSNPYRIDTNYFPAVGDWVHVVGVKDPITNGGQIRVYINGFEYTLDNTDFSIAIAGINGADQIGLFSSASNFMNGSISNVAYWTDTALTQAQVTEIYNSGVPSNLNTFSGTAPAHWLQLGSNSSFNPNPTGTEGTWTCLDEIGTNNAESSNNMTEDAITNGVGYSGNGLGTSSIEIVGDAPYSTANGISENMDVLDRTTDVPS